jgi:hypothetical protein
MRDYRDAKAMARTASGAQGSRFPDHSSLELIAKVWASPWNTLSRIDNRRR